jgi:hypothetical protein
MEKQAISAQQAFEMAKPVQSALLNELRLFF